MAGKKKGVRKDAEKTSKRGRPSKPLKIDAPWGDAVKQALGSR